MLRQGEKGAHEHGVVEAEVHDRVRELVHEHALLKVGGAVEGEHVLFCAAAHRLPLHPPEAPLLICTAATVPFSGSRTAREIASIQDYFLGLTCRELGDCGKHWFSSPPKRKVKGQTPDRTISYTTRTIDIQTVFCNVGEIVFYPPPDHQPRQTLNTYSQGYLAAHRCCSGAPRRRARPRFLGGHR